jgi:hypothetical protein
MKYAIIQCVNGNYSIVAEYDNNLEGAIVKFHQTCANLWNSKDVLKAQVKVVDEFLNTVMNMSESIGHETEEE